MRLRLAHGVLGILLTGAVVLAMGLQLAWARLNRLAPEARAVALAAHDRHGDGRATLLVIDLTRPSFVRRGHLLHVEDGVMESFLVAHGQDSGWARVTQVGDALHSRLSSKGAHRAGPPRDGPQGPELPLEGLDPLDNGNAAARGLALHGDAKVRWDTLWAEGGRLVRSTGAPLVPHEVMPLLIDHLADGGLVVVHWEPHQGGGAAP